ncbi:hypothetical protein ACJIZ3_021312 [Penstemon smallii]|uniref:Beta-glucosidase n=1 Tax=Penstemon smallii TaxID=265156 RepID=A0ABD3SM21_9LAMI
MEKNSNQSKKVSSSSSTSIQHGKDNLKIDSVPAIPYAENCKISRTDFPNDFVFGVGTSAYQHEGGAAKDGRGHSIWDVFTLSTPDRIVDGSNGNVAVDMYTQYKEDIKIMKAMGFDAYRFSISWPRILPGGRPCLGVNKEGIDFYNDIINTCLENEIEPYVTLFHWDLPNCLQLEYGGFLKEDIIDDFREYAELCFWEFGDRVKYWITLNEPWTYSVHGYAGRIFPPGKKSSASTNVVKYKHGNIPKSNFIGYRSADPNLIQPLIRHKITIEPEMDPTRDIYIKPEMDSTKEVYTVARNLLLAHAQAVQSYRTKFQEHQQGYIGITLVSHYFEPLDEDDVDDQNAAKRALDFMLGWFLQPVLNGHYPQNMIDYVPKENLQKFSKKESALLKGSIDFLGLNYYTTYYASDDPTPDCEDGYYKDQQVKVSAERDGVPIGPVAGSSWLYIVPWGIYELLKYINNTYKRIPDIYITENGVDEKNNSKLTAYEACTDTTRMKYHQDHLAKILEAMNDYGSPNGNLNIKGYFLWSWCDNFEWIEGYTVRFGIIYIDYMNNLRRYPKHSAKWFAQFLKRGKKHLLIKEGEVKQISDLIYNDYSI